MKNLTEPLDIRHALEKKLGNGAVKKFADLHGYSGQYISQTIYKDRANKAVLMALADFLGCSIHGTLPSKEKAA